MLRARRTRGWTTLGPGPSSNLRVGMSSVISLAVITLLHSQSGILPAHLYGVHLLAALAEMIKEGKRIKSLLLLIDVRMESGNGANQDPDWHPVMNDPWGLPLMHLR